MATLPEGFTFDGECHLVSNNEDCMGRPEPDYWRQWVKTREGDTVCGVGACKEAAISAAILKAKIRNETEILGPKERLWVEIDKAEKAGQFYGRDLVTVIKLLAQMVSPRTGR